MKKPVHGGFEWQRRPAFVRALALLVEESGGVDASDLDAVCLAMSVHPEERPLFVTLLPQAVELLGTSSSSTTGNAARCKRAREKRKVAKKGVPPPMSDPMSQGMSPPMSDHHVARRVGPDLFPPDPLRYLHDLAEKKDSSFSLDGNKKTSRSAGSAGAQPMSQDHVATHVASACRDEHVALKRSRATREGAATRIPDDWQPKPEDISKLTKELGVEPLACLEEFRDFWRGVPGIKGKKADWDATFRNRVRAIADRLPKAEKPLEIFRLPDRDKYIQRDDESWIDFLERRTREG